MLYRSLNIISKNFLLRIGIMAVHRTHSKRRSAIKRRHTRKEAAPKAEENRITCVKIVLIEGHIREVYGKRVNKHRRVGLSG